MSYKPMYVRGKTVAGTPVRDGFSYCGKCGYEAPETEAVIDHFETEHVTK